jgi:hypothetical protein
MADEEQPGSLGDPLDETGIGRSIELRPGGHLGEREPETEPPVDADFPAFRRLVLFSVLGGLWPLLPEAAGRGIAVEAVCTRMVAELGSSRHLDLGAEEIQILAAYDDGDPPVPPALRPLARLQSLLLRPFPGLTARDGARRAVEVFGRGYLLLHAAGIEMAELHPPDRTEARVRQVRAAIDEVLRTDRSFAGAVAPLLRRSAPLLRRAADLLAGFLSRTPGAIAPGSGALAAENQLLGGLVDQIAGVLWSRSEDLAGLARSFEIELARQRGLSLPGS